MTLNETTRVKSLIASILAPALVANDMRVSDLRDDLDLRLEGLVDSFGFVQLVTELEKQLGRPIDLAELPADQLTKVGPLARHIAWRYAAS